ncbi:hypothetical protein [Nonomuraea sp. NPDC005650]|uniref:hypothetical protein n=1 Tax=Nonomuraea sp. NPDC005650 TaxID=3157045 RepID=UPI0033B8D6F3
MTPLLHDDAGRDATTAEIMLTVMISIQIVAMPAVPALLGERRGTWAGLALTMTLTAAGFLGLAYAPGTATWMWTAALGVGHGGLFTLALTLTALAGRDSGEAGRISAMAFFVGYGCALRDATGNFTLAFGILMLLPITRLRSTILRPIKER